MSDTATTIPGHPIVQPRMRNGNRWQDALGDGDSYMVDAGPDGGREERDSSDEDTGYCTRTVDSDDGCEDLDAFSETMGHGTGSSD